MFHKFASKATLFCFNKASLPYLGLLRQLFTFTRWLAQSSHTHTHIQYRQSWPIQEESSCFPLISAASFSLSPFLFLYPNFSIFSNYSGPVKGLQGCDCSVTISHSCCKIFTTILSTDFVKRERWKREANCQFPQLLPLSVEWNISWFIISFPQIREIHPSYFTRLESIQWLYLPACYGTMTLELLLNYNSRTSSARYASTCINDNIFPSHK